MNKMQMQILKYTSKKNSVIIKSAQYNTKSVKLQLSESV